MNLKCNLFPYGKTRIGQDEFIETVQIILNNKTNLAVHAPTGIGKTVSVLAPAVEYALENSKTIFFLTPRHTQHKIVIDTLNDIQKKLGKELKVVNIIGKRWLCKHPDLFQTNSSEFYEMCKGLKQTDSCKFYKNVWEKKDLISPSAEKLISEIEMDIMSADNLKTKCKNLCPHEIFIQLAKNADVIVADYYHVFHPAVQRYFFNKCEKSLSDAIIIVDEAHNLPSRIREIMSSKLSSEILNRAIKEAAKYKIDHLKDDLKFIKSELEKYLLKKPIKDEKIIRREILIDIVNKVGNYDIFINELKETSDEIRSNKKISYLDSVANFLILWSVVSDGYIRIGRCQNDVIGHFEFSYNIECLDPSLKAKIIFEQVHSTIIMSGTLLPVEMYVDILGLDKSVTEMLTLESPFPKENRLNLIIDDTTTQFTKRSEQEFMKIARNVIKVIHNVPGNVGVFFPSYYLRNQIYEILKNTAKKEILLEQPGMNKHEKEVLFERFKTLFDKKVVLDHETETYGCALFGVVGANFSEGVDFPGDLMKAVVIVGIPLQKPDLKVKGLINYFDTKFNKGLDYGYTYPAMNKVLQTAGRCIRSETDYGVIVFMDSRFLWDTYRNILPKDMYFHISNDLSEEIRQFFTF
ncbi:MAG: ATP-dependent DNA helicase [DPANN group archaeon]|nr:ATP-dependent DNA helicase [DPANN group archaeon]